APNRCSCGADPYRRAPEPVPAASDYTQDGSPRAYDANPDAPTYLFIRGDDRNPDKKRLLAPGLPRLLTWASLDIQPVALPPQAHSPGLRPYVLENYLRVEERKRQAARQLLASAGKMTGEPAAATKALAEKMLAAAEAQVASLKARAAADWAKVHNAPAAEAGKLARAAALAERTAAVAQAEESLAKAELDLLRADAKNKAEAEKKRNAARTALASAQKALANRGEAYTPLRGALKTPAANPETAPGSTREPGAPGGRPSPKPAAGRRTARARWRPDRRNPLTARVAVNHVWARHFGRPLVKTVFDFGRKGSPPSHPALLDWLAVEFMENGWSMKHLHRLIVTSDAYRIASSTVGADPKNRKLDPENRLYWRMNAVRMEAQV